MPGSITLSVEIPQGYLITQKLAALKQRLLDLLIEQKCLSSGVFIEISTPHGSWPVLKHEITRLFLSDDFIPLMAKFHVDLRINDSNHLETSERIHFPKGLEAL